MKALRKTVNIPLAVIAAAALLVCVYQAGAMRNTPETIAPPAPITAAVVDLETVFEQLLELADEEAKLKARGAALDEEDKERQATLQRQSDDLETVEPGTERYRVAEDELIHASILYRAWREFEKARIEREKGLVFEKLYRRVKESVKEMAAGKYNIVILNDSIKELMHGTNQEVGLQISARRILYADDALDITKDLIDRMNNEFRNRQ